jgi:hypothetical protein
VPAHVESAVIFAAPLGCAASHADSHAASVHFSAQSMSAVQSASPKHALACPQQLVSRHESHVGSPLPKPHALLEGGGPPPPPPAPPPPPHALEQLVSMHWLSVSSSAAPVGCDDMHDEIHASSLHASPHAMSAVQSASATQALFCAQQLVSRQASQVASPVERPHDPAPPAPDFSFGVLGAPFTFPASVAMVDA